MDLKYSFLSDAEPTDAQLQALMEEVAVEARKKRIAANKVFHALMKKEMKIAKELHKNLMKD